MVEFGRGSGSRGNMRMIHFLYFIVLRLCNCLCSVLFFTIISVQIFDRYQIILFGSECIYIELDSLVSRDKYVAPVITDTAFIAHLPTYLCPNCQLRINERRTRNLLTASSYLISLVSCIPELS